jgi:hypothetical protein
MKAVGAQVFGCAVTIAITKVGAHLASSPYATTIANRSVLTLPGTDVHCGAPLSQRAWSWVHVHVMWCSSTSATLPAPRQMSVPHGTPLVVIAQG